jgi:hypothetical protein
MARDSGIGAFFSAIVYTLVIANIVSGVFKIGFGRALAAILAVYVCLAISALAVQRILAVAKLNKRCIHGVKREEMAAARIALPTSNGGTRNGKDDGPSTNVKTLSRSKLLLCILRN